MATKARGRPIANDGALYEEQITTTRSADRIHLRRLPESDHGGQGYRLALER